MWISDASRSSHSDSPTTGCTTSRNRSACEFAEDASGRAKWYAPRCRARCFALAYCRANLLEVYDEPSVACR
jgi:hypothetical protein